MSKTPEIRVHAVRKPNYDVVEVSVLRYHFNPVDGVHERTEYLDPDAGWSEFEELDGKIRAAFEVSGMDFHRDRPLHHSISALLAGEDLAAAVLTRVAEAGVRKALGLDS